MRGKGESEREDHREWILEAREAGLVCVTELCFSRLPAFLPLPACLLARLLACLLARLLAVTVAARVPVVGERIVELLLESGGGGGGGAMTGVLPSR